MSVGRGLRPSLGACGTFASLCFPMYVCVEQGVGSKEPRHWKAAMLCSVAENAKKDTKALGSHPINCQARGHHLVPKMKRRDLSDKMVADEHRSGCLSLQVSRMQAQ